MEAAVATKTIWKNQSDMVERPLWITDAATPSWPDTSAISSGEGPRRNWNEPMT